MEAESAAEQDVGFVCVDSSHQKQLQRAVESLVNNDPADICLIGEDSHQVYTQRSLVCLYSKTVASYLRDVPCCNTINISLPLSSTSIKNLLKILTSGVATAFVHEDLSDVLEAAGVLGIDMTNVYIGPNVDPQDSANLDGPYVFSLLGNKENGLQGINEKEDIEEMVVEKANPELSIENIQFSKGQAYIQKEIREEIVIEKVSIEQNLVEKEVLEDMVVDNLHITQGQHAIEKEILEEMLIEELPQEQNCIEEIEKLTMEIIEEEVKKFMIDMEPAKGNIISKLPHGQNVTEKKVVEEEQAANFSQEQSVIKKEIISTEFDTIIQENMEISESVKSTKKTRNVRKPIKNKGKLHLKTSISKKTNMRELLRKGVFDLPVDKNKTLEGLDQNIQTNSVKDEKISFFGKSRPNCELCGKMFSNIPNFMLHMNSHIGEKPFACDKCEKCFSRKAKLKSHEMESHMDGDTKNVMSDIKSVECEMCDKQFSDRSGLFMHNYLKHYEAIPHTCEYCDYKTIQKKKLKLHIISRHGGLPK